MKFFIAGVQFHDLKKVLDKIKLNDYLTLVPDPENKFDPNAVAIKLDDVMLGYVPKKFSSNVAADIELGSPIICKVIELNPSNKPWEMCKVFVGEEGKEESE